MRRFIKYILYAIGIILFAFVTLQYVECYSYRNISEIHVTVIDNVRESFTIPLRKSRGLLEKVARKIPLFTKENFFWIEINDSENDEIGRAHV